MFNEAINFMWRLSGYCKVNLLSNGNNPRINFKKRNWCRKGMAALISRINTWNEVEIFEIVQKMRVTLLEKPKRLETLSKNPQAVA
jgi:hypothetical protein